MSAIKPPLRVLLNGRALAENWRAMARLSGDAATGAAVKADGYGLGGREVAARLAAAGCRDFFVAHWGEAAAIADLVAPSQIAVLNGLDADDPADALAIGAVPVLNTPQQIARWKAAGGGRCHVMLDSGINRLGIGPEQMDASLFNALDVDIVMSHLASADEDCAQNGRQRARFVEMSSAIAHERRSLANSAGVALGSNYHFDLTRPGLALYGGVARDELASHVQQVARVEAQVLQVRSLGKGEFVGYNATFVTPRPMRIATAAIGYADGYLRGFSGRGFVQWHGIDMPVVGRVSMDLLLIDASNAPELGEADWVEVDYHLPRASAQSGLSQYELLTGIGARAEQVWV